MRKPELLTDVEITEFLDALRSSVAQHGKTLWRIEEPLGLSAGFVQGLLEEVDDWAFIIKTSVVVESALGQVLSASLLGNSLDRHISSLPMNGRSGKIQLAQDIGLIGPKSVARFTAISEIRNNFAHGLKVLQLSIPEYFNRMSETEFDALVRRLFSSDREKPTRSAREKKNKSTERPLQSKRDGRVGKYLLWTCACISLLELSEAQRRLDADKKSRDAFAILGHAFVARQHGDESTARQHMRVALDMFESIKGINEKAQVAAVANNKT